MESQRDRERFENLHAWISIVELDTRNYDRKLARFVGSKIHKIENRDTQKRDHFRLLNQFFPYPYRRKENPNRHSFIEQKAVHPEFERISMRALTRDRFSNSAADEECSSTHNRASCLRGGRERCAIQLASTFGTDRFIRGNPRDSSHPSVTLHSSRRFELIRDLCMKWGSRI